MYGAIEFYRLAKEAGIRPIIGCEVYIAPNGNTSRNPGEKSNYHLVLLARNQTGYRNLIQIVTRSHLEGFYYKPRIDKEFLVSTVSAWSRFQHVWPGSSHRISLPDVWTKPKKLPSGIKKLLAISIWKYSAIQFMNWKW